MAAPAPLRSLVIAFSVEARIVQSRIGSSGFLSTPGRGSSQSHPGRTSVSYSSAIPPPATNLLGLTRMIGPSRTVLNAVAHALGRPPLDSEITLPPEAPHQSNRLYDVHAENKHLIAKEYLRADRPDAPRNEYAALRHVQSLQLARLSPRGWWRFRA